MIDLEGRLSLNTDNPLHGLFYSGVVTDIPGADAFSIRTLAGLGAGKFMSATRPYYAYVLRDAGGVAAAPQGEMQPITLYVNASGSFTTLPFTVAVAVGDEILIVHASVLASSIWDTRFFQEAVGATNANGVTWVDLLNRSALVKPVRICGFMVTVAGGWAGNAKIRITDGAGNKIFPFQDEYVEGTDFNSGVQAVFNFPVEVSTLKGYKFQFRSSAAGDGAGKTLQLNNLDVIELS